MSCGSRPLWEMLTGVWLLGSFPEPASLNGLIGHFQAVNPRTGMQRDTNCSDQGSHVYSEYGIRKINKNKERNENRSQEKRKKRVRVKEKTLKKRIWFRNPRNHLQPMLFYDPSKSAFKRHNKVLNSHSFLAALEKAQRNTLSLLAICVCCCEILPGSAEGINFHCFWMKST